MSKIVDRTTDPCNIRKGRSSAGAGIRSGRREGHKSGAIRPSSSSREKQAHICGVNGENRRPFGAWSRLSNGFLCSRTGNESPVHLCRPVANRPRKLKFLGDTDHAFGGRVVCVPSSQNSTSPSTPGVSDPFFNICPFSFKISSIVIPLSEKIFR